MADREWPTEDDDMRRLGYGAGAPPPATQEPGNGGGVIVLLMLSGCATAVVGALSLACRLGGGFCAW